MMPGDDEWYEIVGLFQDGETRVLESAEGQTTFIQGKVEDVNIVQVGIEGLTVDQVQQSIRATEKMLSTAGIDKALILPAGIRFMQLRKVSDERMAELTEKGPSH
jgi:hypothetical protein